MNKDRFKQMSIGFSIGIAVPILSIIILYFYLYYPMSVRNIVEIGTDKLVYRILSLSIIPNLIPFYYFLRKEKWEIVRGLLIFSVLYTIIIYILRFTL